MDPKEKGAGSRQKTIRPELQQVLKTLKSAVKILGYNVRDIERELGYSYGYMSRVFAGTIELKVEHVAEIARVLGMTPAELWAFLYPEFKDPASPAAYELYKRIGAYASGDNPLLRSLAAAPEKKAISEEALEAALRRTLGRVFEDVMARLDPGLEPVARRRSSEPPQMEVAERVMHEDRGVLRKLSE